MFCAAINLAPNSMTASKPKRKFAEPKKRWLCIGAQNADIHSAHATRTPLAAILIWTAPEHRMSNERTVRSANGASGSRGLLTPSPKSGAALALHFAHDNFCRVHDSLRVTPAMAAGITDHIWMVGELIGAPNA